jgi:hypothetical protein
VLLCSSLLPGCQALLAEGTSAGAGVATASLAERVGGGAAVTTGIGLGVQALARAGLQHGQRRTHEGEQDRIAAVAGPLPVGGVGRWRSTTVPIEPNERGEVTVSRVISTGPLDCKEIVFSVETGRAEALRRAFYTAAICRDGETWKWASAEPATERWGSLQ